MLTTLFSCGFQRKATMSGAEIEAAARARDHAAPVPISLGQRSIREYAST